MFFHQLYVQVINSCIVKKKSWERAGYAPRQVVTLQNPEDGVIAQVEPLRGDGWKVSIEGQSMVG